MDSPAAHQSTLTPVCAQSLLLQLEHELNDECRSDRLKNEAQRKAKQRRHAKQRHRHAAIEECLHKAWYQQQLDSWKANRLEHLRTHKVGFRVSGPHAWQKQ